MGRGGGRYYQALLARPPTPTQHGSQMVARWTRCIACDDSQDNQVIFTREKHRTRPFGLDVKNETLPDKM